MRYGSFLKGNGTVGFIAPSFGCATEPYDLLFDKTLEKLESMGYRYKLGPNCRISEGVGISNTPQKCGLEVMDFFKDPESDVLISCGGGELMCEILDFIDFDELKKLPPKLFMGYSDNTNLIFLLNTLCDTAAIYGPCAAEFGKNTWEESDKDAFQMLCGNKLEVHSYDKWQADDEKFEDIYAGYNMTHDRIHVIYNNGKVFRSTEEYPEFSFDGRIIGGCLDCLVNICGTKFDKVSEFVERYRNEGIIWFLESCELNVFSIRRALWNLDRAGWFKYTKGFLIGRSLNGGELFNLDNTNAYVGALSKYNVPIIMDMDIGHLDPMMPILSGAFSEVCSKQNQVLIKFRLI
ncbi:MAG: LD-carboxypeptidase [Acetatifactor sp.]|nr:LD-carboxypeptidase [Acetatifactor sp.]